MKILQIARQFYPSVGGIESVTYGLSQSLQKLGHHCDVLTLRYIYNTNQVMDSNSLVNGLQVYRLPHIGSRRYPIAPGVLAYVHQYEIIHLHAVDFFLDFLSLTKKIHHKPIVINTHGGIFHTKFLMPAKRLFFHTITRLSLQTVAAVICDSEHDYNLFKKIVPANKLSLIRNGVSLEAFLHIKKKFIRGLIVGIGRVVENKEIELLLELIQELAVEFPAIRLVWIGHDPQQRIPQLMNYAERLGIASRVQFVGQIPEAQMCELLAEAHLFVSTASYEAFGLSTIEAMSSGTLPIVTPVGIHPEVIQDSQNGFILDATDKHQMVAAFRRGLTLEQSQLEQMGEKAKQAALKFSWETVVFSYLEVYKSVLNAQRREEVQ